MKRHNNDVWVYAEGGGDKTSSLESELRQAFSEFFDKAGLQKRNALLLVDSETPILPDHQPQTSFLPWAHLKKSDHWDKPNKATNDDCHLMVQCMESWFIADWGAVSGYFGKEFKDAAKPSQFSENLSKDAVLNTLKKATQDCKKGKYNKGVHSFKLLALISPDRLQESSPWAKRFIDEIVKRKSIS